MALAWKKLWSLSIPPKVKIFVWTACAGFLPTMKALYAKHVTQDNIFPSCHKETEDIMHALVTCPSVKHIWSVALMGSQQ